MTKYSAILLDGDQLSMPACILFNPNQAWAHPHYIAGTPALCYLLPVRLASNFTIICARPSCSLSLGSICCLLLSIATCLALCPCPCHLWYCCLARPSSCLFRSPICSIYFLSLYLLTSTLTPSRIHCLTYCLILFCLSLLFSSSIFQLSLPLQGDCSSSSSNLFYPLLHSIVFIPIPQTLLF